jgi:GNAT superfamily N-acetyltransferase
MEDKENATYKVISYMASELPSQYQNMIYSKWLRSLRYGNDYFRIVDSGAFFSNYNVYIAKLLHQAGVRVSIACLSDDPDVVLGWSVHNGHILHYIHVHKDMRRQKIGKSLLPKDITVITHMTRIAMSIWSEKYPTLIFNPFA